MYGEVASMLEICGDEATGDGGDDDVWRLKDRTRFG